MIYRIKDWVENFETKKTVDYNHCQRITFTNNLNKIQRKRLLKHADGPGHLAVWFSICQYHSTQSKPREGYLTVSGKPDGEPLNPLDIAELIGLPEELVTIALERLALPEIGWIEVLRPYSDHTPTIGGVSDTDEGKEEILVEVGPTDDQPTTIGADGRPLTPLHSTPLRLEREEPSPTPPNDLDSPQNTPGRAKKKPLVSQSQIEEPSAEQPAKGKPARMEVRTENYKDY